MDFQHYPLLDTNFRNLDYPTIVRTIREEKYRLTISNKCVN